MPLRSIGVARFVPKSPSPRRSLRRSSSDAAAAQVRMSLLVAPTVELPLEIWLAVVLSGVMDFHDFLALARTCKQLYNLRHEAQVWKCLYRTAFPGRFAKRLDTTPEEAEEWKVRLLVDHFHGAMAKLVSGTVQRHEGEQFGSRRAAVHNGKLFITKAFVSVGGLYPNMTKAGSREDWSVKLHYVLAIDCSRTKESDGRVLYLLDLLVRSAVMNKVVTFGLASEECRSSWCHHLKLATQETRECKGFLKAYSTTRSYGDKEAVRKRIYQPKSRVAPSFAPRAGTSYNLD